MTSAGVGLQLLAQLPNHGRPTRHTADVRAVGKLRHRRLRRNAFGITEREQVSVSVVRVEYRKAEPSLVGVGAVAELQHDAQQAKSEPQFLHRYFSDLAACAAFIASFRRCLSRFMRRWRR
jgi:hypothetical protein